jgi:hypothetical protein
MKNVLVTGRIRGDGICFGDQTITNFSATPRLGQEVMEDFLEACGKEIT